MTALEAVIFKSWLCGQGQVGLTIELRTLSCLVRSATLPKSRIVGASYAILASPGLIKQQYLAAS